MHADLPLVYIYLQHVVVLVDGVAEGGGADLAALVAQVHAEQLALALRVAPRAYWAL